MVTLLPQMLAAVDLPIDHIEAAAPIITGFLGGYVVAMPLLGAYSDARGRLPAYAAAMAAFGLGSALTALSPSLPVLIAGRALQGLGGGALVPLALALAADLYPAGRRAPAIGAVSALQEAGSVFGPIWGAAVAAALGGWRGVFWLNLPLGLLVVLGLWRTSRGVELGRRPGGATRTVDWTGAALLGLGLGLFVLALYPDDPSRHAVNQAAAPLGLASALVLAAFVWSQRGRLTPLVGSRLARSRVFWAAMATNLLAGAALMVALVDVPLLGRGVYDLTTLDSGLLLTRLLVGVPIGALAGGWLAQRFGRRQVACAGLALAGAAFALMSAWGIGELKIANVTATAELVAAGLGFGLVIAPLSSTVLDLTGGAGHGLAGSLVVLARTLGMAVGLASLTAFGLARFQAIFSELGCGLSSGQSLQQQIATFEACARSALLQEYREIFLAATGICALGALLSLLTAPREAARA